MHFQNKLTKGIAILMCALTLTVTIGSACTLPTYAAEITSTGTALSLTKVIDMALTKTGVVANNNWLQKIQAKILNMLNGTASTYKSYLEANGLEDNEESWAAYINSEAYTGLGFYLPNFILQLLYFSDWLVYDGDDPMRDQIMQSSAVQAMCGTASCVQGQNYVIKDEAVDFIHDVYEDETSSSGLGFYYATVYSINDLSVDWFYDLNSYNNLKAYIQSSDYPTLLIRERTTYPKSTWVFDNSYCPFYVRTNASSAKLSFYNADWTSHSTSYRKVSQVLYEIQMENIDFYDYETFLSGALVTYSGKDILLGDLSISYTNNTYKGYFFSTDRGKQIIYNSLTDFKTYCGGNKPVYQVTDKVYNSSNDNSVNFTGDYIENCGNEISYDIIQNEIDNSVDNSDNSVNSIVNSNNTTIINNYYYTTPDSGGDSGNSGDGDGSSFGEGVAGFFEGLSSLLDFILGLIGDIAGKLTSFLTIVYDLIKGIGGTFASFSQLLGELFVFIPQEIIDLISAGIGVVIIVCVIKMIKG